MGGTSSSREPPATVSPAAARWARSCARSTGRSRRSVPSRSGRRASAPRSASCSSRGSPWSSRWGPEFRFFYNDRYRPILGTKHPAALGTPGAEIFPEVWDVVGPEFERVRRGDAFAIDDWLLPLDRNGYLENCWFTLSYSPIRDETGGVGGLLAVVAETTGRVEGERRLATLRELARRASDATTSEQACRNAGSVFETNPIDVPFALGAARRRRRGADGARHRHRHSGGGAAAGVRALPPDRARAGPHARGLGDRPRADARAGAAARRDHHGGEPRRGGLGLYRPDAHGRRAPAAGSHRRRAGARLDRDRHQAVSRRGRALDPRRRSRPPPPSSRTRRSSTSDCR